MTYLHLQSKRIYLVLLLTLLFWASAFIGIKYLDQFFDPITLAFYRYFIASITILLIYFKLQNKQMLLLKDIHLFIVYGVLGYGLYNLFLNIGLKSVGTGTASFITNQAPILTSLIAFLFLNENGSLKKIFGLFVGLIGISIIAYSQSLHISSYVGVLCLILATISIVIAVLIQKKLLHYYHPIEITAFGIWLGTIFMGILMMQEPKFHYYLSTKIIFIFIYLGVFPGALAHLSWSYVLKYLPASSAMLSFYSLPFLTIIFGWIFLNEWPILFVLLGGCIALLGSLSVWFEKRTEF